MAPASAAVPPLVHATAVCCWCGRALALASGCWFCPNRPCTLRQLAHATYRQHESGQVLDYLYLPSPKQTSWHEAVADRSIRRFLFGGAAGPGKSRMLREQLYRFARQVPGLHALLLRRTHKDLDQSHLRFMPYELKQRDAVWRATDRVAEFAHRGAAPAVIRCGYLESDSDIENYLSAEYDIIVPDELVTFPRDPMLELFTRARTTNPAMIALRGVPEQDYDGAFVMSASNPGGRGGAWVKDFFIDHEPDRDEFPLYQPSQWAFYPAYLRDNPYIKTGGYTESLSSVRQARMRQLLDGDWNVFEGQFFDEFRSATHVRDLGPLAPDLARFLSMDWGRNAPGVVLWWVVLADGHYHIEDEFKFNGETGAKMTVKDVAAAIRDRCQEKGLPRVPACWTDPACWQDSGQIGESIAETFWRYGIPVAKANNDRRSGWQRVHEMFRLAPDGQPWLTLGPKCVYLLRTLPALLQAKNDPDDLDTSADDHAADCLRYGGVSGARPPGYTYQPAPAAYTLRWWRDQGTPTDAHLLGSESHR